MLRFVCWNRHLFELAGGEEFLVDYLINKAKDYIKKEINFFHTALVNRKIVKWSAISGTLSQCTTWETYVMGRAQNEYPIT